MFHCKNFRGHLEKVNREIPPSPLYASLVSLWWPLYILSISSLCTLRWPLYTLPCTLPRFYASLADRFYLSYSIVFHHRFYPPAYLPIYPPAYLPAYLPTGDASRTLMVCLWVSMVVLLLLLLLLLLHFLFLIHRSLFSFLFWFPLSVSFLF